MTESYGPSSQVHLIPAGAHDAWSRLADVLRRDGPAPCEADPEGWWPDADSSPQEVAVMVRCCAGCPARAECLEFAVAADERDGIWGGLTRAQRRRAKANEAAA